MTLPSETLYLEWAEKICRSVYCLFDRHKFGGCKTCDVIAEALRESAARTWEEAANNCETRAKDAWIHKLPVVTANELRNRRDFFNAMAASLRVVK